MTSESNRISAASISYVESVCRAWGWSWSAMDQADDDGIDGLVYLRILNMRADKVSDRRSWKHDFTGGLIHVQVKSGTSYVTSQNKDCLYIRIPDLETKRKLWEKSSLPITLIYVKDEQIGKIPAKAWWADLKSPTTYSLNGTLVISKSNRFQAGIECRRPFARLANGQHRLLELKEVSMSGDWELPGRIDSMSKSLKQAAWDFYKKWKAIGAINPILGSIIINRTGWSHITRRERPLSRIQASFELLPAAARIISTVNTWRVLRCGKTARIFPDGTWAAYDYLGLSAIVKWPAREASEVMVILRRKTTFADNVSSPGEKVQVVDRRTWFYSVYEPGRRKHKN